MNNGVRTKVAASVIGSHFFIRTTSEANATPAMPASNITPRRYLARIVLENLKK
jgi:hypothetical protein